MPIIGQGGSGTLRVEVRNGGGALADATDLVLTITDPSDVTVPGFPVYEPGIIHDSTGRYHYVWSVSASAELGTYVATWDATLNSVDLPAGQEDIEVVAAGSLTFRTRSAAAYITPDRYRTMGLGSDLASVSEMELARHCRAATYKVNAFCAVPRLPQAHSFGGGVITGEQKRWTLGTDTINGTRRFYPWHRPVRSVNSMRIRVTNQISVSISNRDLFVNNSEGYVEVVSLAAVSFGIFPAGIVPNLGLATPVAELDYEYGEEFTATDDDMYPYGEGSTVSGYDHFMASDGFWVPGTQTIFVDDVAATSGFTIDYLEGSVAFDGLQTARISADYTFTLPHEIAEASAIIMADSLSEAELTKKGMAGLAGIDVAEVSLRRSLRGTQVEGTLAERVPEAAAVLLEGYRFRSVA